MFNVPSGVLWMYKWYTGSWSVLICDPAAAAAEEVDVGLAQASDANKTAATLARLATHFIVLNSNSLSVQPQGQFISSPESSSEYCLNMNHVWKILAACNSPPDPAPIAVFSAGVSRHIYEVLPQPILT